MFMDIFAYINFFIFGWICCQAYIVWKIRRTLKKIAEDNGMSLEELSDEYFSGQGFKTNVIKVPNLFTESTNNSILLYNKDTGDFVAQANTVQELAENVYKFNKINFAFVKHDEKLVWFVEGKVRDDLKEIE